MKNLYCLLGIFICSMGLLVAQPVDVNMAQRVAENFYNAQNQHKNNASLSLYCAKTAVNAQKSGKKGTYYYIFNDESNGGFVLVSGDKRVEPILGYSTEGKFDTTNMPDNLRYWLKGYEDEIDYAIANFNEAPQESAEKWEKFYNHKLNKTRKGGTSSYWITSTWGQDFPYNEYCPYDNTVGERTVTGCVATAMAQIMKYWEYPIVGKMNIYYQHAKYGRLIANMVNTTYNWSNMDYQPWVGISHPDIATLMYHCGVSVAMDYDVSANGGSSAVVLYEDSYIQNGYIDAKTALNRYWGYNTSGYFRSNYTTANWLTLLKNTLISGIPILYRGSGSSGSGGHAFVCDGYNDNSGEYFHFNWGWCGYVNGTYQYGIYNGYYLMSSLTPGNHNFNYNQAIVIATPPRTVDMRQTTAISVTPNAFSRDSAFSASVTVVNYGFKNFEGNIGFNIYNNSGVYMGSLDSVYVNNMHRTFSPTKTITLQCRGLSFSSGIYYLLATYQETYGQKYLFDTTAKAYFTIKDYPKADLHLSNTISISPTTIYPDSSISVTANIVNQGDKAFTGKIGLDLYNNTGAFLQTLVEANHTISPSASQTISVNQYTLSYPVGTYCIVATYTEQDSVKKIIGNTSDRKYFDIVNLTMVDMALYSAITINPEQVCQNTPLAVSVAIINNGNKDFDGKVGIDLYNNDDVYMGTLVEEQQFVAKKQDFSSLATLNANHQGFAYPAGRYYLVATYTEKNSSKKVIGTTSDRKYFNIETKAVNIQLFSDININPNEVYKNTAFAVSASIINSGSKDFTGYISFDIYNASDDTYVGELGKVEETVPHATYKTITINRNDINYAVGRYFIISSYMEKDSLKWKPVLSDKYNTKAYFEIKTGVNIEEHQTWQAVLYPNPSIDKFILKTSEILDNTIAEIFDMTGKSLYKTTINSQETILDLTSFRQGVYLLKVTNKDNLHMYKLIKQ